MFTMHEIVGARRQRAHSDRSSWWLDGGDYRSRRLVSLPILSPFVFSFLFGVLRYPLGIMYPSNSRTRLCHENASFTPTGREISRIRHRPVS